MNIIGFTGLAGSGKTTAARQLVTVNGWTRISFADPLRAMLAALGVTHAEMANAKHVPLPWLHNRTPRELLQTLGTEWGRTFVGPDVWVAAARRNVEYELELGATGVVFDDCRFENEAAMIRQMGGLVIELRRSGTQQMAHASEAGVPAYLVDAVIVNDGLTEAQLGAEIQRIRDNQMTTSEAEFCNERFDIELKK